MGAISNLVSGLVGAVVGAVVGGAINVGGSLYQAHQTQELMRPGHVNITQPAQYQAVSRVVQVRGDAEIPNDQSLSIWLVVHTRATDHWYPQGYAPLDQTQHWTCTVTLGSNASTDDGDYDVLAVLASPANSAAFSNYAANLLPTEGSGMRNYPKDGVDVKSTLHLTRNHLIVPQITKQQVGTCR